MKCEKTKDIILAVLVLAVVVLLIDRVWLHLVTLRRCERVAALEQRVTALENPPTLTDKAKGVYEDAKSGVVSGYNRIKSAASAGLKAVKEEFNDSH